MKEKKIFKTILIAAIIIVVLVIGALSIVIIPAGHTGVVTNFGAVSDSVLQEGLHFKVPFVQNVVKVDNRVTKVEVPFTSASRDLQTVEGSVSVNYRISPDSSALVYQNFGRSVEDTLVIPAIPECIKAVMAQYSAEELITKRQNVSEEIKTAISEKIDSYGMYIEVFNMTDFNFSEEFNAAIEAKQTAQQNALKAEQDLERIKVEAEQKVEEAKAEAEAYKLKNAQITDKTLLNDWIEKWDGKLPQVSGDGTYMFDISKLLEEAAKETE
ncbi:FtsH protease regulator HflK [uncultured Ruminococcus sp.]|uniref:Prohibitin family protein n=1 Tax=Massiliimalia timonensis TaxID=1987501 RepID=A0A8J6P4H2_9FIRM|nr:prohibitin family protein [Massiliimalia timonensis]MBC8611148.1 prohibitin family protein [Massiliimalia timonensis]SCI06306.1 FtsH protease regulator HflK [uncultured Clostridium sp.]SCI38717.1 FtsH protease regulator HflK [uncultured Ruminococcus sp.]